MIKPSRGDNDATAVLLITVEEYFQARAFRDLVSPGEWEALPSRVELGVDRLLELLQRHGSRATFFFHPWPAGRRPDVVGRVAEAGHEVAALGECGARSEPLTREEVLAGVGRVRGLLEELCDGSVRGHRSPSSSLSVVGEELYDMLVEEGYTYCASGVDAWPWDGSRSGVEASPKPARETEGALLELTTTKLKLLGRPVLPACGTVLRNVPPRTVATGLQRRADEGHLPVFHMHTWEVDPDQPDLHVAPIDRLRHYRGLEKAVERLEVLLSEMRFDSVEGRFELKRPDTENGRCTSKERNITSNSNAVTTMDRKQELLDRIIDRKARIGVIGLGYVGLPVATAFARSGFSTMGFDIDEGVVETLEGGASHVGDVPDAEVAGLLEKGAFGATTDFDELARMDALIICVPSPLSKTGDPDLSSIVSAAEAVTDRLRPGQLVILESTSYPGTTREVLKERMESTGLTVGRDLFLAFSPERIDPANEDYGLENTPKVVGGLTGDCLELATALYEEVIEQVVAVSSLEAAELTKLLENTFRAVNIGLVNEMAVIADRLGIDIWEVVNAAGTKPYGFMRFTPGPGLGGHCLPIDPQYLAWKMKTLQYRTRFIELASEVNAEMPRWVVTKITEALNQVRKAVNGSRVLLLGVAYKPDVSDTRESPALDILHMLRERGAEVAYHDPHVPELRANETHRSVALTVETLEEADIVVVTTDHRAVDYELVVEHADIVVDTRDALRGLEGPAQIYPIAGSPRKGKREWPAVEVGEVTVPERPATPAELD